MKYNKMIENWFEEKESINETFEVVVNGVWNFFDKESVKEIFLSFPYIVQKAIERQVTKIEFTNSDPNDFIEYTLKGYVGGLMQ